MAARSLKPVTQAAVALPVARRARLGLMNSLHAPFASAGHGKTACIAGYVGFYYFGIIPRGRARR